MFVTYSKKIDVHQNTQQNTSDDGHYEPGPSSVQQTTAPSDSEEDKSCSAVVNKRKTMLNSEFLEVFHRALFHLIPKEMEVVKLPMTEKC